MVSTILDLPLECQQLVLRHLNNRELDIVPCMSVCKSWKNIVERLLYQYVSLDRYDNLIKFVRTLHNNQSLRALVTELYVEICDSQYDIELARLVNPILDFQVQENLFSTLFDCLPNLIQASFHYSHLQFLRKALSQGKLPRLAKLDEPAFPEMLDDYIACAHMLRDRLEILSITDPDVREYLTIMYTDDILFDQTFMDIQTDSYHGENAFKFDDLFRQLDQYKKLNSLLLARRCDNKMSLVEQATKICPRLKTLKLGLLPPPPPSNNRNVPHRVPYFDMTQVQPAFEVNRLILLESMLYDQQFTDYIMRKFPRLESINICEGQNEILFVDMDESQRKKVLDYVSKAKKVCVQVIPFKDPTLTNTIGSFWEIMAKSRTVSLEFRYEISHFIEEKDVTRRNTTTHRLHLSMNDSTNTNIVRYTRMRGHSNHHVGVIAKYGQHIHQLAFHGELNSSDSSYEALVLQPLKHCVNLKKLSILKTYICGLNQPGYNLPRKEKFKHLRIMNCTVENFSVYEKISSLFASIEHLQLGVIEYRNLKLIYSSIEINMRETDIITLSFSTKGLVTGIHRQHKLLVKLSIEHRDTLYMQFSLLENRLIHKIIDSSSFIKTSECRECFVVDMKFKSLDVLKVEHFEKKVRIPIYQLA